LNALTPEALNLAQQETDWPARLAWVKSRLLLAQGQNTAALAALAEAEARLDKASGSQRFNPAGLRALKSGLMRTQGGRASQ